MKLSTLALLLAACGGAKTTTTTGTEPAGHATSAAKDSNVKPGHGWTRTDGGTWMFQDDNDVPWTQKLGAEPGGRGIQWMKLPDGAHSGKLVAFSVGYASAGSGTWSVFQTGKSETPTGAPLGTIDVTITPTQVTPAGGKAVWTRHQLKTPVAITLNPDDKLESFDLVFETKSGEPTVAAFDGEDGSQVRYQPPGAAEAKQTQWTAYIRAELADVE